MKSQDGYLTNASGKWLGHFSRWIIDHQTGAKKRQQRAFVIGPVSELTKTQARDKLRERLVQELGLKGDGKLTVKGFIEQNWKPLFEGGWRKSTKQTNEVLLKIIIERFGNAPIEDVTSVHLQAWLNTLAKTRSESAILHLRIFARSIFNQAVEQDFIRKNPAKQLRIPKTRAVQKAYLTLPQIKELLKAAKYSHRDLALLRLMFVTALRPSELFALRWRSIDMQNGLMTISETVYRGEIRPYTKTTEEGEEQHLVVPAQALNALAEWHAQTNRKEDDDFIFPNTEGGFITKENYQRRTLDVLATLAGIPNVNFQILRRTVATHAQNLGSLKDVQTILRHKKMETTQNVYVQVIEESVKETGIALAEKLLNP